MNEPYPDGSQPSAGGSGQPDYQEDDEWLRPDYPEDDEWFRPQRGQDRRPDRHDLAEERSRGRHQRRGGRRHPAPDRTRALDLQATSVDLNATSVDLPVAVPELLELQALNAGRKWVPIIGSVLFLIDTIVMADGFTQPVSIGSKLLVIFIWLVSAVVIAVLWLRVSPQLLEQGPLTRIVRIIRVVRTEIRARPDGGDAVAR